MNRNFLVTGGASGIGKAIVRYERLLPSKFFLDFVSVMPCLTEAESSSLISMKSWD